MDPHNPVSLLFYAWSLTFAGRNEEAYALLDQVAENEIQIHRTHPHSTRLDVQSDGAFGDAIAHRDGLGGFLKQGAEVNVLQVARREHDAGRVVEGHQRRRPGPRHAVGLEFGVLTDRRQSGLGLVLAIPPPIMRYLGFP